MSSIQKTLDSLQPYVIGIRYVNGVPLIDTVFKEGWTLPEDVNISKIKGDEGVNYYMIFSEADGFGIDSLLEYVEKTIKINLEREKKHELLVVKVNELKELFKTNSLSKLTNLKFVFGNDELLPSLNDFDVEEINTEVEENKIPKIEENLDELSEEEREILEEEKRGEQNRKILEAKKNKLKNISNKIELPPKNKMVMVTSDSEEEYVCECGENEACDKCIDKK